MEPISSDPLSALTPLSTCRLISSAHGTSLMEQNNDRSGVIESQKRGTLQLHSDGIVECQIRGTFQFHSNIAQ